MSECAACAFAEMLTVCLCPQAEADDLNGTLEEALQTLEQAANVQEAAHLRFMEQIRELHQQKEQLTLWLQAALQREQKMQVGPAQAYMPTLLTSSSYLCSA